MVLRHSISLTNIDINIHFYTEPSNDSYYSNSLGNFMQSRLKCRFLRKLSPYVPLLFLFRSHSNVIRFVLYTFIVFRRYMDYCILIMYICFYQLRAVSFTAGQAKRTSEASVMTLLFYQDTSVPHFTYPHIPIVFISSITTDLSWIKLGLYPNLKYTSLKP